MIDTADTEVIAKLSAPALTFFSRIAALWKLSATEQRTLLGGIPKSTYHKYLQAPETAQLSRDTLDRISHIVSIYKAINVLLPRAEAADAWIRRPNSAPLFNGTTALDYMLRGGFDDIANVRRYLDSIRGQ